MNPPPSWLDFLKLGIEHIWTGYDHLLFLAGLLIVCSRVRDFVVVISGFTVAHSITLALAATNTVNLPGRLVEPMIAATILYVGVENLLRRGSEPRGRWVLAFVFGLVHGFGFAGVLRECGLGAHGRGIALPLFSFNLGVEIGQIAVAAVVLPVIWKVRKHPAFNQRVVPIVSGIVALTGLYWMVERIFF